MDKEPRKLLITGATGWLGQRLLKCLRHYKASFESVRCLVPENEPLALAQLRDEYKDSAQRYEFVTGDITNKHTLLPFFQDCDGAALIHCAGIIHAKPSVLWQVNVDGTRNLLNLAMNRGIKRVVYVSSNSPCGFNLSNRLEDAFTDDFSRKPEILNPYMAYGRAKAEAEQLVWESTFGTALKYVIIRPTWFYGPGQPPRQTEFFKMVRDGRAPIVGDGTNLRSMTYVDNLVGALIASAALPWVTGQTYWISDKRPYSMNEIVDTIEDVLEKDFGIKCKGKRLRLPRFVSPVAQRIDGALQRFNLYNQKIHVLGEMGENIFCDISKAQKWLGYNPDIELRAGMCRSIQDVLDRWGRL